MKKISQGILSDNGKRLIALGSHYYPSFHSLKVPVWDEDKRLNEAKIDIKAIKDLGFNVIRFASIGELTLENEKIKKDFTFVDSLISIAKDNDLSSLVRLQGYSSNLHNVGYALMQNQDGEDIPLKWDNFIRNCLNNPSVKKEDEEITSLSAKHFKENENIIGFQIYNEPAYPFMGFYDYNPYTLLVWQHETGMTSLPPKNRPKNEEELESWTSYRLFNNKCLNDYLVNLGKIAKKEGDKPAFTCLTPCAIQQGSAIRGSNMFSIAKGMDFLGITIYLSPLGAFAREYNRIIDESDSIARLYDTHAWAIECDAKVDLPPLEYEVIILSLLGAGFKGIMPYQYRADATLVDSPEPNKFGIVYNDLTPTAKYDAVKKMNDFINDNSEEIASMEALHQEVGIYVSEEMNVYQDALLNSSLNAWKGKEQTAIYTNAIYSQLVDNGFFPKFVNLENISKTQVLLMPSKLGLSAKEKETLEEYQNNGGVLRVYNPLINSYEDLEENKHETLLDCLANKEIYPIYLNDDPDISIKILKKENNYLLFVINHNKDLKTKEDVEIKLPFLKGEKVSSQVCFENGDGVSLLGDKLHIKSLSSGIIIRLRIEENL